MDDGCSLVQFQIAEDTILPVTSDIPGVSIDRTPGSPDAVGRHGRYNKSLTHVTIGGQMYHLLKRNENRFFCIASTKSGEMQIDYFTIRKMVAPYNNHHNHHNKVYADKRWSFVDWSLRPAAIDWLTSRDRSMVFDIDCQWLTLTVSDWYGGSMQIHNWGRGNLQDSK